ncbi:MAG: hypothetical protein WBV95_02640 [Desulfobacterales bacterium]
MKYGLITVLICIVIYEIFEHLILPLFWMILYRKRKSSSGPSGMIGKKCLVKKWDGNSGKVQVGSELDDQEYHRDDVMVSGQDIIFDAENATSNDNPGVKVLSKITYSDVLKIVDDFRKNQPAINPNSTVSINLSNEFAEILSAGHYGMVN